MRKIGIVVGAVVAALGTVVANIGFVLIEWGYRLGGDSKAEAKRNLRRVVEHGFGRLPDE